MIVGSWKTGKLNWLAISTDTAQVKRSKLLLLTLIKGVPECQKNTWGWLNIFMHWRWTYLPPRDLYDVILPNLGLFWCFLAQFCPKSTCLIHILMFLHTVHILLDIYCKISLLRCVTSWWCIKHWCQRVLVKMSIKPVIIFSEVNILYHGMYYIEIYP